MNYQIMIVCLIITIVTFCSDLTNHKQKKRIKNIEQLYTMVFSENKSMY